MGNKVFSDLALIFSVSWSFLLARFAVAAFGREIVPRRIRTDSMRLRPDNSHLGEHER